MTRHAALSALLLLTVLALPSVATAQSFPQGWTVYRAAQRGADADLLETSIEAATQPLGLLKRTMLRARLRRDLGIPTQIAIQRDARAITVRSKPGGEVATPADGTTIRRVTEDGEHHSARQWVDGDTLVQIVRTGDVTKTTRFELSSDASTLRQSVVITMPDLAQPIRYEAVYRSVTHRRLTADLRD